MAHDNLAGASVVVGFDGSEASLGSVVVAAREAVMRSRPLEIRRDQYEAAEDADAQDVLPDRDRAARLARRLMRSAPPQWRHPWLSRSTSFQDEV